MGKNESLKPKGKGEKALRRLIAINSGIKALKDKLDRAAKNLISIIEDKESLKGFSVTSVLISKSKKQRNMLDVLPKRIEFDFNNLRFYIDFALTSLEKDDHTDIKGSIIYGTNRTLCFSDCLFPEKNDSKKCENCERIVRCDRLEDKPLVQFSLNQNGMIKSNGDLNDEWWIEEKKDLLDLHLRALDLIWKRALAWTNENILP